ncbi:ras-related protein Rab-30-like isoform X2 [Pomacea canaliculata]|uniref:ras-related protein Rab-30-like isoform X2 n=1 Tax=Pomacea canaliculata TaxID=400727 RepID=UPI000D733809|nr:ras-related protein Rab-30-like isoform X2 [Pomacea canaliculata]
MNRTPGHLTKNYHEAVSTLVWIKIVGIGNAGTGKTCLIKHFCESKFSAGYQPTVGVDYGFKIQTVKNTDLRVHLWDLSGSAEYLDVRNELYCGSDAIFIVYDVTSPGSFEALESWVREANRYATGNPDIVIVGNKVDLKQKRVVSSVEAKDFALLHNYRYFETSAATGDGVDDMFQQILTAVCEKKSTNCQKQSSEYISEPSLFSPSSVFRLKVF